MGIEAPKTHAGTMDGSEEVRCPGCNRLNARIKGSAAVEIKCPRCGDIFTFNSTR